MGQTTEVLALYSQSLGGSGGAVPLFYGRRALDRPQSGPPMAAIAAEKACARCLGVLDFRERKRVSC